MPYKHLERYGLIGNLETSALVGDDGAIDWLCVPHVESSSIFARILDSEIGGHFTVHPSESFNSHQRYVSDTNVLQTIFQTASGNVITTDFMPISESERGQPIPKREVCRRIRVEEGRSDVRVEFVPAFDYALGNAEFERRENGATATDGSLEITYHGMAPDRVTEDGAFGTVSLSAGEERWLRLSFGDRFESASEPESALAETIQYWRRWVHNCDDPEKCNLRGPWHDYAVRSGLVLKLLTHRSTGAICAAPTTSLPEEIGGSRNWDYRYNWLRDTAFTTQALYKLGHEREALEYLDWILKLCQTVPPDALQPLYGLHGDSALVEQEFPHLEGYQRSQPVRIGNAAHKQFQLDIYGELLDAIYETTRYGKDIPEQAWDSLRNIINYVCEVWDRPDSGIWEVRSEPENFVYSKVMCWVALDRGIRLQGYTDFSGDVERWEREKSRLRQTVLTEGYNESLGSFVRSFENRDSLDAASLLIAHRGFIPFRDERMQGTIDRTLERLTTDEGFVYRYEGEAGVSGRDGAFLLCSFWLIDALTLSGRTEEATKIFKKVTKHVSPLGLLAEEIDPETGRQLGNVPQAFSHIGLVNSAVYLTHAAGIEHPGPEPQGVSMAGPFPKGKD